MIEDATLCMEVATLREEVATLREEAVSSFLSGGLLLLTWSNRMFPTKVARQLLPNYQPTATAP